MIQRTVLLNALLYVVRAVEKRQTMPILSHVLLIAHQQSIKLITTDTEIQLQVALKDVEVVEQGATTLPGKKLLDICRSLPEQAELTIEHEMNQAVIRSGRSRFSLAVLSVDDFPQIEPESAIAELNIHAPVLHKLLKNTQFAMALQDVRYFFNGVMLALSKGKILAVATNGHRLAFAQAICPIEDIDIQVILPRKGVNELHHLLDNLSEMEQITVNFGNYSVWVESKEFIFTSKLIDGKYPDYQNVVPRNGLIELNLQRDEFKAALNRTMILANEQFNGVQLRISEDSLLISAHNPDQEVAEEELAINYQGESFDICFNAKYLLDILNVVPEGEVRLTLSDAFSSVLIESLDDDSCLYVVMPIRL